GGVEDMGVEAAVPDNLPVDLALFGGADVDVIADLELLAIHAATTSACGARVATSVRRPWRSTCPAGPGGRGASRGGSRPAAPRGRARCRTGRPPGGGRARSGR